MERRKYLLIGVGAAVTGLSGCLSFFDSEVQLALLEVQNETMEEQSVDFRVLDGDQQMLETEVTIDPAEQTNENTIRNTVTNLECEWGTEPRDFQLEARLDEEWETVDVASEADSDCVFAGVQIVEEDFLYFRVGSCEEFDEDDNICPDFENELEF